MKFLITTLIVVIVFNLGAQMNQHFAVHHKCNSPCLVKFPSHTQEDEFKIDFYHSKLKVVTK